MILFAASACGTAAWCGSMRGGMEMPGGWTMSMAWMRMPGQGWPAAATAYLGMWALMMAAMMAPSLVAMLARYRAALRDVGVTRLARPTLFAALAYLAAWTLFGAAVYAPGVALASAAMRWSALARLVPAASAAVLLLAGAFQLSRWKLRRLEECRSVEACCAIPDPVPRAALRAGARMGAHCILCCLGFMAALLVLGVMDLAMMAVVAAALTFERLAPDPAPASRIAAGLLLAAGAASGIATALRIA